jgi:hypothetical protein
MKGKKNLNEENLNNKNSYNELLAIYNRYYGEYKPRESKDNTVSKEADMGEGKLFTKFIMKK